MAGITKCTNAHCPLAESCYRKTAPENEFWQSWSEYQYVQTWRSDTKENVVSCEGYLEKSSG